MNRDNLKIALYAFGGFALAYIGYSVYRGVKESGQIINNVSDAVSAGIQELKKQAAETVVEAGQIIDGVKESARGALLSATGETNSSPDFAKKLDVKKWDSSTVALIRSFNVAHNRKATDYSGWQVFSNGIIITPAGEYIGMDYASPSLETNDGFAAKLFYSPNNTDIFESVYPGAQMFIAQGFNENGLTAGGYYSGV